MFYILAFDPDTADNSKWYKYEGLEFETKEEAEVYLIENFGEETLEDGNWRIREQK